MATQGDADAAQSYIGQDASEATVAEAKAAAGATGALRVIKPGQPVTMDFRAARHNVQVDDDNALVRITWRRPAPRAQSHRLPATLTAAGRSVAGVDVGARGRPVAVSGGSGGCARCEGRG